MGIGASTEERSTEEGKDKMNQEKSEMAKKKKGSRSKSRSESGESTKKEERGVLAGAAKTKEERKKSKTDLEVRRVLALESVADSMEALVSKTLFKRR